MTKLLRMACLILWLALMAWWGAAGMNTGWTKTSVSTMQTDAITGIEYPVWIKQLIPGMDLLVAGTGCAAALIGLSFLPFLNRKSQNH